MFLLLQAEVGERAVTSTDLVVIGAVFLATLVASYLIRPLLRSLLTWVARRSLGGHGRWRVRTPRVFGETLEQAELRRRQRIAATAAGLSRVLTALLWVIALLVVLHRAEIDPVFAISAAGFLGVGMAVGGQHSVNDFLTGLHILLEDRFGEGDTLRLRIGDDDLILTVVHLGAFATRLEDGSATLHIPNREMTTVANLSQRGSTTELAFEPTDEIEATNPKAHVEAAVRSRYAKTHEYDGSRDGLVVDSVDEDRGAFTVRLRTARPLSDDQRDALSRKATRHHSSTRRILSSRGQSFVPGCVPAYAVSSLFAASRRASSSSRTETPASRALVSAMRHPWRDE